MVLWAFQANSVFFVEFNCGAFRKPQTDIVFPEVYTIDWHLLLVFACTSYVTIQKYSRCSCDTDTASYEQGGTRKMRALPFYQSRQHQLSPSFYFFLLFSSDFSLWHTEVFWREVADQALYKCDLHSVAATALARNALVPTQTH